MQIQCSSPIQILHSLISLSLSSSGFADASVAPIDFPIAPAAAVPKVLYFNNFFECFSGWPSGQGVGLAIRQSLIRVPLWPLVLSSPELKPLATLVNSQLQLPPTIWGFNPVMLCLEYLFLIILVECL